MTQTNARIDQLVVHKNLLIGQEHADNPKYQDTLTFSGQFRYPVVPNMTHNRVTKLRIRQILVARNSKKTSDWDRAVIEFDILLSVPSYQNIIKPFEIYMMKKVTGYSTLCWDSDYMELEEFFDLKRKYEDKYINKSLMMQLLQGLTHLRSYNVAFIIDMAPNVRIVREGDGFRLVIVDLRDVQRVHSNDDIIRSIYVTGIILLQIYTEKLKPNIQSLNNEDIFECLRDGALTADQSDQFLLASLILAMTQEGPIPSLQSVVEHPYFWGDDKKLNFILTTHHEKHSPPVNGAVPAVNESRLSPNCDVTGNDWRQLEVFIDWNNLPGLENRFHNIGHKYYDGLKGLVKFFRDKYQHYTQIPEEMQALICGTKKDDSRYLLFFTRQFPALLGWLWHSLVTEMDDHLMRRFYSEGPFVKEALHGLEIPRSCVPIAANI